MQSGGKGKIIKPQKTKFSKERDEEFLNVKNKQKKRDKTLLRLMKQDREYVV